MHRNRRGILARAALAGALTGLAGAALVGAFWLAAPGPVAAERAAFAAWLDGQTSAPAAVGHTPLSIAMRGDVGR